MMTTDTQQTPLNEFKPTPFGARLRSAREAMGLERKDAAAQLRLSEKVIAMLEKENFPSELPITFIRGYIRSYGKLLQIPELEITKALEPIQPKPVNPEPLTTAVKPPVMLVTSSHYYMQVFTYCIVITLVSLVGIWWYSHSSTPTPAIAENHVLAIPANNETPKPADNLDNNAPNNQKIIVIAQPNNASLPQNTSPQTGNTTSTTTQNNVQVSTANNANSPITNQTDKNISQKQLTQPNQHHTQPINNDEDDDDDND